MSPTTHKITYQQARRFAVAPMLAYTNRHARYLYRILSRDCLLYTEMLHANAVLGKKGSREIDFDENEKPLIAQLAGSDKNALLEAAQRCEIRGYDGINLNIGCPSNKVRMGEFGACLMAKPHEVALQVAHLKKHLKIPVSVKCRLGIDNQDYTKTLPYFVSKMYHAGCDEIIIHARIAMLQGYNPKQNLSIPPLDYSCVYTLIRHFPDMHISINGGIETLTQAQEHLAHVPGVMLGRAVLHSPMILRNVGYAIFSRSIDTRTTVECLQKAYAPYIAKRFALGDSAPSLLRPIINLFRGKPGGAKYRRVLSTPTPQNTLGKLLLDALDCLHTTSTFE